MAGAAAGECVYLADTTARRMRENERWGKNEYADWERIIEGEYVLFSGCECRERIENRCVRAAFYALLDLKTSCCSFIFAAAAAAAATGISWVIYYMPNICILYIFINLCIYIYNRFWNEKKMYCAWGLLLFFVPSPAMQSRVFIEVSRTSIYVCLDQQKFAVIFLFFLTRNCAWGYYLAPHSHQNKFLLVSGEPSFEWKLQESAEKNHFAEWLKSSVHQSMNPINARMK